jgi:hypothetical protein
MHHLRTAALALLMTGSTSPPTAALADAFLPGEETTLAIRYLGLPSGEGTITVGQPSGDLWPVIFQARTSGLVGLLDVREHLTCLWDAGTGLSRGSDLRAIELGDHHADSLRFDREAGTATVTVRRRSRRSQKVVPVPADAHDLTGAVMWLRRQPLAAGQVHRVPVLTGARLFTLAATVEGTERLDTPAGPFDALRVRARLELSGQFATRRDVVAWFSDDPRHVLVRLEAEFAFGAVVAELRRYRAGSEVAVR